MTKKRPNRRPVAEPCGTMNKPFVFVILGIGLICIAVCVWEALFG